MIIWEREGRRGGWEGRGDASLSNNKKMEGSPSELYWVLEHKLVRGATWERSLHLGGRRNDDL